MQYFKLGFIKIPYQIKNTGKGKVFQILGIKIPFSVVETGDGGKFYEFFGIKFPAAFKDRLFITRKQVNYQNRNAWGEREIKKEAESIFKEKLGYTPDLDNPKSFNEKIFWMKLNYHNPLVTKCCDKFAVKGYVDEVLGEGYTIPVIDSWESGDDIDFSALPKEFVLKVNWSSGYNIIVKDKTEIDKKQIRKKINHWLEPEQNSYYQHFNWGYKEMKPVVYAEEYKSQLEGQLYDYKFYCINGKCKFLFIATDRYKGKSLTYDFFDLDFNHLDFSYGGRNHADPLPSKPKHFDEMVHIAELLSKPFPFVRVDFYEVEDRIYVGEMTFYSGGGILKFEPQKWDWILGESIDISAFK